MSRGSSEKGAHDQRNREIRAEQIRLLYSNVNPAVAVTIVVSSLLGYVQWEVISHSIVLAWLTYMLVVSLARFTLARIYWRTSTNLAGRVWGVALTIGAGLSGAGWGAAAVVLYPQADFTNQVFLTFAIGGMMLGSVSILAPRPEVFLAFILPTGIPISVRLLMAGGIEHFAIGLMAVMFNVSIVVTTWHIYRTITRSLTLLLENEDLLRDLQAAKEETEALNRELERRVEERTAELHSANELLSAEIKHRKQAEDELLRARKLESLGVLVGGIAHDFNNFLTIVQGNIGLAKVRLANGNPVDDVLDQTGAACERAASLASQLLTFGRGGAPVRRTVSAAELIEESIALASAGAEITITAEIADDLWPVDVDASQISHVLHNILLNARQAMPEGGRVEVRAENLDLDDASLPLSPGAYVRISARDHGCGIPADILPRVFDPYFTTKPGGTGLGLAAAHAIVSKHDGHITAQSVEGAETTFAVYLPASDSAPLPQPSTKETLHAGSGRILVMDDEEAIRKLLRRMLMQLGYEVECAKDGAEAVALCETAAASGRGFDAVLLDLTIPGGIGGREAAARLREIDSSMPLIVSSGYSDAPVLSEFRDHGFDAVLRKPWRVAELSQVIRQVVRGSRPDPGKTFNAGAG